MFTLPAIKKALKSQSRIVYAIVVLALLGTIVGGWIVFSNQNTAAIVEGKRISKTEFERRVEVQTYFYTKVSPSQEKLKTIKSDTMDFFVKQALMEKELRSFGQQVTEKEIDEAYATKAASKGGLKNYDTFLKETYQMEPEDLKITLRSELLEQKLTSHDAKSHLYGIWLNKVAGDALPEQLTAEQKASHAAVKARAEAVLARVKAGEDFGKLADEFSEDPQSKARHGDLGVYGHFSSQTSLNLETQQTNRVYPSVYVLEQALKELGEGEAKVFDYPAGYSVIKATDVTQGFDYQTIDQFYQATKKKADIIILVKI